MREQRRKDAVWRFLTYAFVITMVVVMMVPLYWMLVAATLPQEQFLQFPPRLIPGTAFLDNFAALQERLDFVRTIRNSVLIAVVLHAALAGVVLDGRLRVRQVRVQVQRADLLHDPGDARVADPAPRHPAVLVDGPAGLDEHLRAIILPWAANPIGIFLMRQNMKSIPDALLESARMDGATEFQIFYRIALPTMRSSLAALAIILFLFQWDLFLYPLVILETADMYTIPIGLAQLTGFQRIYYDQIMVAATLAIVPMVVLFLVLQKQFVSGILAGSLKE